MHQMRVSIEIALRCSSEGKRGDGGVRSRRLGHHLEVRGGVLTTSRGKGGSGKLIRMLTQRSCATTSSASPTLPPSLEKESGVRSGLTQRSSLAHNCATSADGLEISLASAAGLLK